LPLLGGLLQATAATTANSRMGAASIRLMNIRLMR
jgi:hypothetical protein